MLGSFCGEDGRARTAGRTMRYHEQARGAIWASRIRVCGGGSTMTVESGVSEVAARIHAGRLGSRSSRTRRGAHVHAAAAVWAARAFMSCTAGRLRQRAARFDRADVVSRSQCWRWAASWRHWRCSARRAALRHTTLRMSFGQRRSRRRSSTAARRAGRRGAARNAVRSVVRPPDVASTLGLSISDQG